MTRPTLSNPDRTRDAPSRTVVAVLKEDTLLLDARILGEYAGVVAVRPGTAPGAHHMPHDWFIDALGLISVTLLTLYGLHSLYGFFLRAVK